MKYVRVMDKDVSNASGIKFKIGEVNVSTEWDPNAKTLDTIKGINFSTDESIIRWIRRGDTIYDVELPPDAEVIKCPGTFTPDGIYRTNKIIVKNPVPLTEDVVMNLYKKSKIPEKTYHDVFKDSSEKQIAYQSYKDAVFQTDFELYRFQTLLISNLKRMCSEEESQIKLLKKNLPDNN